MLRYASQAMRPLGIGLSVAAAAAGLSLHVGSEQYQLDAAAAPAPQPTVVTDNIGAASYLTIVLSPKADVRAVARVLAGLQDIVAEVADEAGLDANEVSDNLLAGAAFSLPLWSKLTGSVPANGKVYKERKGKYGKFPATGGDIFVHIKAADKSKAFEVTRRLLAALPSGSVAGYSDIYGWTYKEGRDLSGFIDGTENVAGDEERRAVAVNEDGSAFIMTQVWEHDIKTFHQTSVAEQEKVIGRSKPTSEELSPLPPDSHVGRLDGAPYKIVRQSMPYGSLGGRNGLFFIAYAKSTDNFDHLLDLMVGADGGPADRTMTFTQAITGQYWYCPSPAALAQFAK